VLESLDFALVSVRPKKIFGCAGTAAAADHYPLVTAETPLPSKRLVIRSRKASVVIATEAFFIGIALARDR
jgi:hypothetical protein